MYIYVFGYFSNSMCEKKRKKRKKNVYMYIFFGQFSVAGKKRKMKNEKKSAENWLGYCPIKLYCDLVL